MCAATKKDLGCVIDVVFNSRSETVFCTLTISVVTTPYTVCCEVHIMLTKVYNCNVCLWFWLIRITNGKDATLAQCTKIFVHFHVIYASRHSKRKVCYICAFADKAQEFKLTSCVIRIIRDS